MHRAIPTTKPSPRRPGTRFMYAYNGKILIIDLPSGESTFEPLTPEKQVSFIGGAGLGAWLLYRHCPPGVDPLSPESPLIFARGPFLGAGVPGSAKMAVACKSPLTGLVGDSLSSGPVAEELSRMPFDALVIKGRVSGPAVLHIEGEFVRVVDAGELAGLSAREAAAKISSTPGLSETHAAAIGPAGEALVRFACISNGGRQAGRTGAGAVMGSKNLKAIALKGDATLPPPDPDLAELNARLGEAMRSKSTAKYRGPGTVGNLAKLNAAGALPAYNFRQYTFDGAANLSVASLEKRRGMSSGGVSREWEHVYSARGSRGRTRLEYESLFAFGPMCGISDPDTVILAAGLCDDLGVDTISTGGALAWAMESYERGILTTADTGGLDLRFGNGDALLEVIEQIARKEGIGELLSAGSRGASARLGSGSEEWAMHVKGLEMPGYHPGNLRHLALALAVSPRGACHNRASAYDFDLSDEDALHAAAPQIGQAVAAAEDFAAVLDSLVLSKFVRRALDDFFPEAAQVYRLATGHDIGPEDLRASGERISLVRKAFNVREGWSRTDDTLPPRIFEGGVVSKAGLDEMIGAYYGARGWSGEGLPGPGSLPGLGMFSPSQTPV